MGLIVAGAVSTGGLATLSFKVADKKLDPPEIIPNSTERSSQDVD